MTLLSSTSRIVFSVNSLAVLMVMLSFSRSIALLVSFKS